MAEQAETTFARTFLNTLSTQPIIYADDYQQPLEQSLKRIPVLPVLVLLSCSSETVSLILLDRSLSHLPQNVKKLPPHHLQASVAESRGCSHADFMASSQPPYRLYSSP